MSYRFLYVYYIRMYKSCVSKNGRKQWHFTDKHFWWDFPVVRNPTAGTRDTGDMGLIPGVGRFPWRRKWQSTPVFLLGESHGQKSLAGCSPWGCKESDMTERLSVNTHKLCCTSPKNKDLLPSNCNTMITSTTFKMDTIVSKIENFQVSQISIYIRYVPYVSK